MFIIIRGRVSYLITMDLISVKDSVNFIGCNVIICLQGCGHTKHFTGHTIAFKRFKIDPRWLFVGRFDAVGLICWGIMLHSKIIWIVRYGPVFVPFAPVASAPVIFFCPRFTRCRSSCFPWSATIVNTFVTTIVVFVSLLKVWLFI